MRAIKYIDQSYQIITPLSPQIGYQMVKGVEATAQICYQTEDKNPDNLNERLLTKILKKGHHAMLEHGAVIQVNITTSRAVANELVRHRMASYAQESTRWVAYKNDVEIVRGSSWAAGPREIYDTAYREAVDAYHKLLNNGTLPQYARDVLPLALATQISITANLREWMHIFRQRTAPDAHPDMISLMAAILRDFQANIPLIFDEKMRQYWP